MKQAYRLENDYYGSVEGDRIGLSLSLLAGSKKVLDGCEYNLLRKNNTDVSLSSYILIHLGGVKANKSSTQVNYQGKIATVHSFFHLVSLSSCIVRVGFWANLLMYSYSRYIYGFDDSLLASDQFSPSPIILRSSSYFGLFGELHHNQLGLRWNGGGVQSKAVARLDE